LCYFIFIFRIQILAILAFFGKRNFQKAPGEFLLCRADFMNSSKSVLAQEEEKIENGDVNASKTSVGREADDLVSYRCCYELSFHFWAFCLCFPDQAFIPRGIKAIKESKRQKSHERELQ